MSQEQEEQLLEEFEQLLNKTKKKRTLANQTYNKNYYNNNFKELLKLGQYYEKLSVKRIVKHFNMIDPLITFNDDNKYDVKINDTKYEVKTDIKAITTSNVFIEFIQNNKISGISTTEAHYYIIVIPHKVPLYLLIEVDKLRTLINDELYIKIFQPNKWNNGTGGFIFSVDTLLKHSTLI